MAWSRFFFIISSLIKLSVDQVKLAKSKSLSLQNTSHTIKTVEKMFYNMAASYLVSLIVFTAHVNSYFSKG